MVHGVPHQMQVKIIFRYFLFHNLRAESIKEGFGKDVVQENDANHKNELRPLE